MGLCGPLEHPEVSSDLHWDMHLYGLTTCLCLLLLLSALLTRVVCAHALFVSTSVFPPRSVHVCMHACICMYTYVRALNEHSCLIFLCAWQPCLVSDRLRGLDHSQLALWEVNGVPSFSKASLNHLFLQGGPNSKVWLV